MSDILDVLPDFDSKPYRHLTYSLEKNGLTTYDLLTLDATDIARRCPLPLNDLRSLIQDVITALQQDVDIPAASRPTIDREKNVKRAKKDADRPAKLTRTLETQKVVRTLDPTLDAHLGGGLRTAHISEIVGESAVGKTQFVLGLLLSCQLPPPKGLGRAAMYISTEAPLNTARLTQMLESNPVYQDLPPEKRPSLDRVHTIATNDLEIQERIIQYQLPIAVQRFNIGLVVVDSVAANFRAEHATHTTRGLVDRAVDLIKLGSLLRKTARDHNVAVVVTNQVSDRFDDVRLPTHTVNISSSPAMSSPTISYQMPPPATPNILPDDRLSLDFQQQFFTGWANHGPFAKEQPKTPALGLAWANQLSARIVLKTESERGVSEHAGGNIWKDKKRRRFVSVVFAPWVAPSVAPIEYEIQPQGVVYVPEPPPDPHAELLDPSLWFDGGGDVEEEFP